MTITTTRRGITAPLAVGAVWGFAIAIIGVLAFVLINPLAAHGSNAVADQFDVTIHWFDAGDSTCELNVNEAHAVGCFRLLEPNVINVQRGLDPVEEQHTILHEIGHVLQSRMGMQQDECLADRFAQSMGSELGYYCPPE